MPQHDRAASTVGREGAKGAAAGEMGSGKTGAGSNITFTNASYGAPPPDALFPDEKDTRARPLAPAASVPAPTDTPWSGMPLRERMIRYPDICLQILAHQISSDYTRFFKRCVKPRLSGATSGLNLRGHSLLLALGQMPDGQTGVELAFLIRTDPATVSRNIRALTRRGLVSSREHPSDARACIYTLTPDGSDAAALWLREWDAAVAAAEAKLRMPLGEMQFRSTLSAFYDLKDRARCWALYTPGRAASFRRGIGRPAPGLRPSTGAVRDHADSFFRFFGQQVSSDYLLCLSRQLARPTIVGTEMSLTDLRILIALDFCDEFMSGAELARSMRLDPATVTRGTALLCDSGLLRAEQSPADRRRNEFVPTEAGRAIAARYRAGADTLRTAVDESFEEPWSRRKRAQTLDRILTARDRARAFAEVRGI